MSYRSVRACAADDLAAQITDAAVWFLMETRTAPKGTDRHFNLNEFRRRPSVRRALASAGADLKMVVGELLHIGYVSQGGPRSFRKTRSGNIIGHEFRDARSILVLNGDLEPTIAETVAAIRAIRFAVHQACLELGENGV